MNYLHEQKRTLSFRRLPFAAKRRRARPMLGLLRRLARLSFAALPMVALCAWLLLSPRFRLQTVQISGGPRVAPEWIETVVADLRGHHLMFVDLDEVRDRLRSHPWIAGLRLSKQLPDGLRIAIEEHQPQARLTTPAGAFLLSAQGQRIVSGPEVESWPYDVLLIESVTDDVSAALLKRVLEVRDHLATTAPEWARSPQRVRVLNLEDAEFRFADVRWRVRLPLGPDAATLVEERLRVFDQLVPQLEDRLGDLVAVDLRFDGRLLVTPERLAESSADGAWNQRSWMSSSVALGSEG